MSEAKSATKPAALGEEQQSRTGTTRTYIISS